MEGLIPFIIAIIIGSILRGNSKKAASQKGQPTTRPVSTQRVPNDPMRRLKEMSREMVRELQQEYQTELEEPPSRQSTTMPTPKKPFVTLTPVVEVEKPVAKPSRQEASKRQSGRLSAHGGTTRQTKKITHHILPRNQDDIMKGIIFSEIIGPPKAKR